MGKTINQHFEGEYCYCCGTMLINSAGKTVQPLRRLDAPGEKHAKTGADLHDAPACVSCYEMDGIYVEANSINSRG